MRAGQRVFFWVAFTVSVVGGAFLLIWKAGPDLPTLFGFK
jgi:hypothetical protein